MKWIGQHIWDFISRFRTTVYIENLETSSEENVLVVDSDGKVTKNTTLGGSDLTLTNETDNRVITSTGGTGLNAEANFTFNGSSLALTGVMDISPANDAGVPALLIDNDDTDQIALSIDAANTTGDIISVTGNALTTGSFINYTGVTNGPNTNGLIDIDITNTDTTSNSFTGMHIDYNKSGALSASQVAAFTGINIDYADTATNNAAAIGIVTGAQITLTNDSDQGVMAQTGLNIWCTGSDAASTSGIIIRTPNDANDLRIVSQDGVSDIFTIDTKADGETTLTTIENGGGSTAHMNLVADGDINLDAAGDIEINADGGNVTFKDGSDLHAEFDFGEPSLNLYGQSGDSGKLQLYEDSDNGTNFISFRPPQAIASNKVIDLPDTAGTVQLQGANTGQIVNVKLNRDDTYVLYLSTRTYWYSVSGTLGYTGNIDVSAGNWSSWSDDRQARHSGYVATSACKVNKVRFVGLFSTSYTSAALDFEFAIQKWTPGNNTTSTVTTTYMTHTDHDGSYTEGSIYNLEFTVSGNNTLAAGDAFTLFARCVDSDTAARLQLWYGNCNAEIELT